MGRTEAAEGAGMGLYYITVNTCGKCFSEMLTVEQHSFRELINTQMIRPDWNTLREVSTQAPPPYHPST